jgi:hypothetical protein
LTSLLLVAALGCSQSDGPPVWYDAKTGCEFVGGQPCEEHYALWVDIYDAACSMWSNLPDHVIVTIVHSPHEEIFRDGSWQTWPEGNYGLAEWDGNTASIYVGGFYPSDVVEIIMAHELTHAVWRIRDHTDEFYDRYQELIDYTHERGSP